MGTRRLWFGSFVLSLAALPVIAHEEPPRVAYERAINVDAYQTALLQASGHPNELSRWHGIWAYDNGRRDEARKYFLRAASYGDKLSQHVLSLLYWNGDGVDRDPVRAYVWADLAAERGGVEALLRIRERIWSELDQQQRREVREIGPQFYAHYGDEVAQKRANAEIRRFMRTQTGSRVGLLTSRLDVHMGRPDLWASGATSTFGSMWTTGTEQYADHRTRPAAYWQSEDLSVGALLKQIGAGRVEVGPARRADDPAGADDGR